MKRVACHFESDMSLEKYPGSTPEFRQPNNHFVVDIDVVCGVRLQNVQLACSNFRFQNVQLVISIRMQIAVVLVVAVFVWVELVYRGIGRLRQEIWKKWNGKNLSELSQRHAV